MRGLSWLMELSTARAKIRRVETNAAGYQSQITMQAENRSPAEPVAALRRTTGPEGDEVDRGVRLREAGQSETGGPFKEDTTDRGRGT